MLLVEHDIDRVFQLADHVTVMNEGQVLVDGTVEDARQCKKVREVYIGSGAAASPPSRALRAAGRPIAADARPGRYVLRQESHTHLSRSTSTSTRSSRCSAAMARASRHCSRR